jgi:hypothetical protein
MTTITLETKTTRDTRRPRNTPVDPRTREPVLPELGSARALPKNPVITLGGQRWKISMNLAYSRSGTPKGGTFTFEKTALPESPQGGLGGYAGEPHLMGQPTFRQNPVFPRWRGKPAKPLLTLLSGWGDWGSENFFLATDENQNPCAVFHEFACY